jgi:hypothetical protein
MSHIAKFLTDILTFAEQDLSIMFYLSAIGLPAMFMLLSKQAPQVAQKYIGIAFRVITGIMFVAALYLFYQISTNVEVVEGSSQPNYDEGSITSSIYLAMYAIYSGLGFILGFSVLNIASNPKKAIPAIIGIAGFFLVLIISYQMADDSMQSGWEEKGVTIQDSIDASAGIVATGILVTIAIGTIVIGEIYRLIK